MALIRTRGSRQFSQGYGILIVAGWLLLPFFQPGLLKVLTQFGESWEWYWWDLSSFYYYHASFALIIMAFVFWHRVPYKEVFGRSFTQPELLGGIELTIFIFLFSTAALYAVFIPLSYLNPNFVQSWYVDLPPLAYVSDDVVPLVPNLLSIISLCIAAPVFEEFAFRGILLHCWSEKWGITWGVATTSLLFAINHTDPLGAFAFGVGMCVLYLKTQSLWLPIICHSINNFLTWVIELNHYFGREPGYYYTLDEFRNEWRYGVGAAIVCAAWFLVYIFKRRKSDAPWKLPAT